ncbi:MAG: hypothetical protein HYX24_05140 [Candidatus Aenigmarchaeota archaeon]|nr:hypothetical protein [Candidatus Aenigmarchaeota archaeon]
MKGQMYMIAAFALILLFSIGIAGLKPSVLDNSSPLDSFLENAASEFPRAYNLEKDASDIHNFTEYLKSAASEKNINLKGIWLVSIHRKSGIVLNAGNLLGSREAIAINIGSRNATIELDEGGMGSAEFDNVGESFLIEIAYQGRAVKLPWKRDKDNMYAELIAESGSNVARKAINA